MLIAVVAPGIALADNGTVRLALRPVGQSGSFFDLTMLPGESRSLEVDISNSGDAAVVARTYAADAYTIINGGFGARLRDDPQTDTTRWLDYSSDVLQLAVGAGVRRSFAVTVPADSAPGEYIASLVLENDRPLPGNGAVALNQVVRQAVAVVVTVPGQRSPALAIGLASHKVVAGRSVVSVAVENIGNIRLKPRVKFALVDASGTPVSESTMPMDTFYAHTNTFIEMPLSALLLPGSYTVRLTLDDAAQGVRVRPDAIALVVEAPAEPAAGEGNVPGPTKITQNAGTGQVSLPLWSIGVAATLVLALFVASLALGPRRRRPAS
jgi:hypothetical protein